MSYKVIDENNPGVIHFIDTTLSVETIRSAIRAYEWQAVIKRQERRDADRALELRTERQRLVAKIQRTGLRVQTQDQQFSKYGWDVELERKSQQYKAEAGSSYTLTFKPDTELEGIVKLRKAEGIDLTETIVESFGGSFFREYKVALTA